MGIERKMGTKIQRGAKFKCVWVSTRETIVTTESGQLLQWGYKETAILHQSQRDAVR